MLAVGGVQDVQNLIDHHASYPDAVMPQQHSGVSWLGIPLEELDSSR
jgi:hypothetical protein